MSEEYQSRSRSKSNLLALNYDRRYPNLKVARKCKSYLATMGLPRSNGEHFLWPEEAVYLLETCSAVIFANDRPLTVLEAYRILEEKKVPHFKYLIYATLKKSGFVVVRPNRKEAASKLSRNDSKPTIVEKDSRAHLLDCFPSLDKNGLHLPFIGLNTLTPGICNDLQPPHLSVLQFTRDSNRLAPCRPQYMPELGKIIEAKNWKEFILLKNMTLNRKNRYKKSYTARGYSYL